jgi:hypothetical protein
MAVVTPSAFSRTYEHPAYAGVTVADSPTFRRHGSSHRSLLIQALALLKFGAKHATLVAP